MHSFPAGAVALASRSLAQGRRTRLGEPAQGLDVDMDQLPSIATDIQFGGSTGSSRDNGFKPSRASTATTVDTDIPNPRAIA